MEDEFSDDILDNASITREVADKEYAKQEELMRSAVEMIPPYVKRIHGCNTCEWHQLSVGKEDFMCSFHAVKRSDAFRSTGGICPRRAVHLLSFSKDPTAPFDYSVWQNDYNNAIAQREYMKDVANLNRIDARLDKLNLDLNTLEALPEAEQDMERISDLRKDIIRSETSRSYARRNWESLMEKISKNNAIALARSLAEQKLSDDRANGVSLRPSDIAKMINATKKVEYVPNPKPREAEFVRDAYKEVKDDIKHMVGKRTKKFNKEYEKETS
jgi:vacuolar-type H+-ATPase subunit I/STV1